MSGLGKVPAWGSAEPVNDNLNGGGDELEDVCEHGCTPCSWGTSRDARRRRGSTGVVRTGKSVRNLVTEFTSFCATRESLTFR